MISEIGILIGCYVITRMVSFITRNEKRQEHIIVKILSIITILVTFIIMYDLFTRSGTTPTPNF